MSRLSLLVSGLSGLLAFLLLHLLFVLHWQWFAAAPWPGYEAATARGIVEPWFVHTPRSLWLTRGVLFLIAATFALARPSSRMATAISIWLGAGIAALITYATTSLPSLPWGWLGFAIYPLRLALPVLLGAVAGALLARFRTPHRADS